MEETKRHFQEMMAKRGTAEVVKKTKKVVHSVRSGSSPEVKSATRDAETGGEVFDLT